MILIKPSNWTNTSSTTNHLLAQTYPYQSLTARVHALLCPALLHSWLLSSSGIVPPTSAKMHWLVALKCMRWGGHWPAGHWHRESKNMKSGCANFYSSWRGKIWKATLTNKTNKLKWIGGVNTFCYCIAVFLKIGMNPLLSSSLVWIPVLQQRMWPLFYAFLLTTHK